ncbi:MAG: DUF1801 domain-containing protein [Myxococcales bacterium FL481]|nr:MAG: DUF1801 domain-containing protein [Myxococcales bacterium FL481]
MRSAARTVAQYLAEIPEDRREVLIAVRDVIRDNLDPGFTEGMQYGMIGYYVAHDRYPAGYHCDPSQPLPFASLAAQKNHLALYLFCIYAAPGGEDAFRQAWRATGKRLDMGKACVRFKRLEDVALDVIADAVRRITVADHIAHYEESTADRRSGRASRRAKPAAKRSSTKQATNPRTAGKKKPEAKPTAKRTGTTNKAGKKKTGTKRAAKK